MKKQFQCQGLLGNIVVDNTKAHIYINVITKINKFTYISVTEYAMYSEIKWKKFK